MPIICTPGEVRCYDANNLGTCNATGTGWNVIHCNYGCSNDQCNPPPPECYTNADCPAGYECVNGSCVVVPVTPPSEKKFPWWILLVGGGIGLSAYAYHKYKKKRK